jgi:CheY-like chemotaxis protein
VLIVEDDPGTARLFRLYLEHAGYRVDSALNGAEALGRMRSAMPDAVLVDLDLPFMSGRAFVQALRQDTALASAAVILVSGAADLTAAAAELGVRGALAKPVPLDVLLAVVDRVSQS